MIRFLTGQILIFILLILAVTMIGGRAVTWLHPAPWVCLVVVVVPFVAVLTARPWEALRQAIRDALHPAAASTSLTESAKIWKLTESCLYFGGGCACLMGLMVTFTFLGPDPQILGPKLAASLEPLFVSLVLGQSCRILRARVEAPA